MADKKISALTAASTPLAGTEVLPIVQSGTTVKVSVENVLTSAQPSGAANTVAYLNGSKQLSYSGNLGFDGSTLTFGVGGGAKLLAFNSQIIASVNTAGSAYTDLTFDANDFIVRTGVGGATESLRISDTGNVTNARGNLIVGTAGKGIDFSANGGDVLTQYDEGTWTPNFSAWTTAPTFSDARYIRIGSQVTVCILGQNGVNAGGQAISGLPFTSSNAVAASGVFKSLNSSATFGFGAVDTGSTSITAINAITFSSYWAFTVTYFVTF